ncbi:hypothetical protein AYO38_08775 [bacterium SCGC AG-212-C10]|nr:hypothetical protein AYO38_08775 [bacterium SCGC AG-212-C10]
MAETTIHDEAHRIIDRLPENASWDDLLEEIHLQLMIERGFADIRAGRKKSNDEVRREYGLTD